MKYGEVKDAKENVCPNAIGLGLKIKDGKTHPSLSK
jgi:hypothetical protein